MKEIKYSNRISKEILQNLVIEEKKNYKEICKILNIKSNSSLYTLIKLYNIERIDKHRQLCNNDKFFDDVDSEIKAYLLGFLIADGCVIIEPKKRNGKVYSYSKRISILNSVDDLQIIKLFQQYICPKNTIKYNNCQLGVKTLRKQQCNIRWTSSYMVDKLISYGIKPKKTYDTDFKFDFSILKTEELKLHFLRGFFDGDGCISITRNKYVRIGFVGTSYIFMNQIIDFYKKYNLLFKITTRKSKNMLYYEITLTGGKLSINKFKELMYQNSNFYLDRKLNKFIYDNTVLNSTISKGVESV
jgi:intein/homing endonuclease